MEILTVEKEGGDTREGSLTSYVGILSALSVIPWVVFSWELGIWW